MLQDTLVIGGIDGAAPDSFRRELSSRAATPPELTIVIPTFCERDNLEPLARCIAEALAGVQWEIIFVDDNSPDGTAAWARALAVREPRVRCIRRIGRRGLSGACLEGMLACQSEFVAVMDGDLQHDERLLKTMLEGLRSADAQLVIGTRYIEGGSANSLSLFRSWGSRFANSLTCKLLGATVSDPMSGFFMLRTSFIEDIAPKLSPRGFKILMDILANADPNIRILEIPYRFRSRKNGESKLDSQVILDFLELLITRTTWGLVPDRLLSFMLVGATGVLVHISALTMLHMSIPTLPFTLSQSIATIGAMFSNFFLNNALTYRDRRLKGRQLLTGLVLFAFICSFGAISNVSVASLLYSDAHSWWLPGLCGAIMSAIWNYSVSRILVWRV
jgi:dolichol-phosphate mannosyltransferase